MGKGLSRSSSSSKALLSPHCRAARPIGDWAPAEARDFRRAKEAAQIANDVGLVLERYDGYDTSERRLATLLWRWNCPKVDWPAFM